MLLDQNLTKRQTTNLSSFRLCFLVCFLGNENNNFTKTILPLALGGDEMIIANSVIGYSSSPREDEAHYLKCVGGIISFNYVLCMAPNRNPHVALTSGPPWAPSGKANRGEGDMEEDGGKKRKC